MSPLLRVRSYITHGRSKKLRDLKQKTVARRRRFGISGGSARSGSAPNLPGWAESPPPGFVPRPIPRKAPLPS
jgi:hypothetical protein